MSYEVDEDLRKEVREDFKEMANVLLKELDSDSHLSMMNAFNSMVFLMNVMKGFNDARILLMNTGIIASTTEEGYEHGWAAADAEHPLLDEILEDEDTKCDCDNDYLS